jgi:hypothetical protein
MWVYMRYFWQGNYQTYGVNGVYICTFWPTLVIRHARCFNTVFHPFFLFPFPISHALQTTPRPLYFRLPPLLSPDSYAQLVQAAEQHEVQLDLERASWRVEMEATAGVSRCVVD